MRMRTQIIGLPAPEQFPSGPFPSSPLQLSILFPGHCLWVRGLRKEQELENPRFSDSRDLPGNFHHGQHDWELCLSLRRCDHFAATLRASRPRRLDSRWPHRLEADPDAVRGSRHL